MSRRVRFGSTTDGTLDALDGQIDTGNENGNNPDNDLVIRDSTGTIVARYNESATTWQLEQPLDLQSNNVTNVGALDVERLESDWVVDVAKYASIQDGIEEAESTGKGLVIIPPGTYDETVEITDGSFDLYGFGRDSTQIDAEESEPLIKISGGNNVSVFNMRLRNRGEGDALELNSARNHLKNAQVREGDVRINDTVQNCSVIGCDLVGNDVVIDGDNNVVIGNNDAGTIENNGTGNEVNNNT